VIEQLRQRLLTQAGDGRFGLEAELEARVACPEAQGHFICGKLYVLSTSTKGNCAA
jgi:hypothetical protein